MHFGQLHRIDGRCFAGPRLTTAASASLSAGACNSTSKIQLPIWPSVANAHPPRGGTKDAISPTARRQASARADVRRCVSPSPHSSRESRWCTVVEISLARPAPFGVWGFSLLQSSEPPHLVAGGLDDGLAQKEGTICLVHAMLGELETGGVQLLAQFLLSVRVNCRRGAFVGIEGDSPLGLSSHIRHVWRLVCLQCACMYAHPSSAS